jgi:hypothetical protein
MNSIKKEGFLSSSLILDFSIIMVIDKIATPKVLAFARDYFDCPSLDGVLLENQDSNQDVKTATTHIGSHFEQALAYGEMMAPISQVY